MMEEARTTMQLKKGTLKKLRLVAIVEGVSRITDMLDKVLDEYIDRHKIDMPRKAR